eukprot:TRINITY_DN5773_c0_g1_i14.p1 TRINITY_DN5773_c0_g1~~TRINITY_DN5773_c0_g1_i14.p1  ORF type:complete len:343 (-),score=61.27 TRINITY_DN5773_c0_g1_i14:850-1878(-)
MIAISQSLLDFSKAKQLDPKDKSIEAEYFRAKKLERTLNRMPDQYRKQNFEDQNYDYDEIDPIQNSDGRKKVKYKDININYKTQMCSHITDGKICEFGDKCIFAHSVNELYKKPSKDVDYIDKQNMPNYKTNLCTYFDNGFCKNGANCTFAHGTAELHKFQEQNLSDQQQFNQFQMMMPQFNQDYIIQQDSQQTSEEKEPQQQKQNFVSEMEIKQESPEKALDNLNPPQRGMPQLNKDKTIKQVPEKTPEEKEPSQQQYNQILQMETELKLQYKELGNKQFKIQNYIQAIELYSKALLFDDNQVFIYENRAACYFYLKKYQQCITDCDKCVIINPDFTKAYL